jgi:adenylate kinase family enzyme
VNRVAIVGCGGAGKSTFARRLGAMTGLPVIHLDAHYWRPGWIEPDHDDWITTQTALLRGDRWIADGNYGRTFDVRFQGADTVIVLGLPRLTCMLGALRRWHRHRGQDVQAPGCPERLSVSFLRWIWNYDRRSRPTLESAIQRHADHLDVVRLQSRRGVDAYLTAVAAGQPR